jgi:hypothetical protein
MNFNLVLNRKSEKVLKIEGFKLDEFGEEKTIFVNLNKVVKNDEPNNF